jgi:hypothetical protein
MSATTLRISIPLTTKAAWAPKHLLVVTPVAPSRRHKPRATASTPPTTNTRNCPMLIAKALKVTLVLDPAAVVAFRVPNGDLRTTITISVGGRTVTADLASKSIRKAITAIGEHGVDGVACVLQGKLRADNTIDEAGLVVQPRTPPVAKAAA